MATRVVEISLTEAELDAAKTGRKLGYKEGLLEAAGMADEAASHELEHRNIHGATALDRLADALRSKASE